MGLCSLINEKILSFLRDGILPWRQPWGQTLLPSNAMTKRPYTGINTVLLWAATWQNEFKSPYWASANTWRRMGYNIPQDARPTDIVAFFKLYSVYNGDQVKFQSPTTATGSVDKLINQVGAVVYYGGDKALYDSELDVILIPDRERFETIAGFECTRLHELSHWSGGRTRLGRYFGEFGSTQYAFEELIAELSACYLAALMKVPAVWSEMPNHASYIGSWLKQLESNEEMIFNAATQARRASRYLMQNKSFLLLQQQVS